MKNNYVAKAITKWEAPDKNDVRVLGMPPIFEAVQGKGCQPRTIERPSVWDKMRKRCYFNAGYKCEVCGAEPDALHAHEVFSTNYKTGEAKFERLICLCKTCHLLVIHTGRALTRYKHGDPLYSKERLLKGAEHAFKLVSEYNKTHKDELLLSPGLFAYTREKELAEPMKKLIEKYKVHFYSIPKAKDQAPWGEWHVLYKGKKHPTPYKDHDDWEQKMADLNKKEGRFKQLDTVRGGVFDEIDKLIEDEKGGGNEV